MSSFFESTYLYFLAVVLLVLFLLSIDTKLPFESTTTPELNLCYRL